MLFSDWSGSSGWISAFRLLHSAVLDVRICARLRYAEPATCAYARRVAGRINRQIAKKKHPLRGVFSWLHLQVTE